MCEIGVGVLGFGTVGAGTVEGLLRNGDLLSQRLGVKVVLKRIADLDTTSNRGLTIPEGMLVADAMQVINDPEIQIIVELIGGCGVARKFVLAAIEAGKSIVTANKKLLAEHGDEIFSAAEAKGVDVYFGAAVGGGIPIIRVLREGLAGNEIRSIDGILNGTCNYILTRMEQEGLPFDVVLKAAQEAGFAEADPTLDIDGWDTAHKAAILASLAYGFHLPLKEMAVSGIRGLNGADVRYARELGYRIKLLAMIRQHGHEIEARVHPTLVPIKSMLGSVSNVFNAVLVNGDMSDQTLYYGRGAGRAPTASTVVGDIGDVARNIASGKPRYSRALAKKQGITPTVRSEGLCESCFYLRVQLIDKAGTFGKLASILGAQGVNIRAASQREEATDSTYVPVVVLTNATREDAMARAVEQISQAGIAEGEPVLLRML